MTRCYATGMALDPTLLDILACPEDKGPLLYFAADGFLYNPRLKRKYRIEDDVPVMLIDEAQKLSDAEHDTVMKRAAAEGIRLNFS